MIMPNNSFFTSLQSQYVLPIWSQIGWFGCVYAAKFELEPMAWVFPLVAWGVLILSRQLKNKGLALLALLATVGAIFDGLMAFSGLIRLEPIKSGLDIFYTRPWLVAIWLLFVTALPAYSKWLSQRLFLAFTVGAIAGPLAYLSGQAFEVLYFKNSMTTLIYAAFWGVYFSLSVRWIRRYLN
jgi:Protein of unknown function (DUF2878)